MREFFYGDSGGNEDEYQQWLSEHPDGYVISLNKNAAGKYTLHRPYCQSISYPQIGTGHEGRSAMICCGDKREVEQWLKEHVEVRDVGVSEGSCPQCS